MTYTEFRVMCYHYGPDSKPKPTTIAQDLKIHKSHVSRALHSLKNKGWIDDDRDKSTTYVYLMRDERTGYVKIGRSKSPSSRERTLQSDNPLIVLVASFAGTPTDERNLHTQFKAKRVRGEWFDLTDEDVAAIHEHFKTNG